HRETSYNVPSKVGLDEPSHCCRKWKRNMVSTANAGRPPSAPAVGVKGVSSSPVQSKAPTQAYLIKKDALARLLGSQLDSRVRKTDLFHNRSVTQPKLRSMGHLEFI
ncbi:MAG: hypothetical protein EBY22_15480, partial [Gammaproteobacteria bacterium]|nr:hypothetical protein [Gammaproteobacteria bacterium]